MPRRMTEADVQVVDPGAIGRQPADPPAPNGHGHEADAGIRQLAELAEQARARGVEAGGPTLIEAYAGDDGILFGDVHFDQVCDLDCAELYPLADQGREDFGDLEGLGWNIKEHGLQEPVIVRYRPVTAGGRTVRWQIVAGERRWRASVAVGLETIRAIPRRLDDRAAAEVHLLENALRRDLNPIEQAREYRRYLEATGAIQAELGKVVGKSQGAISNALRLLDCPAEIQAQVISGEITAYHARVLLGLDPECAEKVGSVWCNAVNDHVHAKTILEKAKGWTSTQTEQAVRALNNELKRLRKAEEQAERVRKEQEARAAALEATLSDQAAGLPVAAPLHDWAYPEGAGRVPEARLGSERFVETECETCARRILLLRTTGRTEHACADRECRARVMAQLQERASARAREREALAVETRRRIRDELGPAELFRLALYELKVQASSPWQEDELTRTWEAVPSEVTGADLARAIVEGFAARRIREYESWMAGGQRHLAVKRWLADLLDLDREWLLGPSAEAAPDAGAASRAPAEPMVRCNRPAAFRLELVDVDGRCVCANACENGGHHELVAEAVLERMDPMVDDWQTRPLDPVEDAELIAAGCEAEAPRMCRQCGCTDDFACMDEETGAPCSWVEEDLCSACAETLGAAAVAALGDDGSAGG